MVRYKQNLQNGFQKFNSILFQPKICYLQNMKRQEPHKPQLASVAVSQAPKSSKFSASCKFLCCAIFIIGVLLNLLLSTILLFGVENYHKADPVKIYEVFQTPKYAETNNLLDSTQYLVLYGEPQSGIINFIQHEANLRAIEGQPVVMREIEQNIIHKHIKESRHFVEMYLGAVPRGHHSWFILLENSETPNLQIESLKKKYPKDSIVLVAHQKLNVQGFVNHKFPALKAKELKEFMEKDLNIDSKEVNQVLELAASKDTPTIFEAYKSFEESKARAFQEAERQRQQKQEEERLRLEEEERKAAEKHAEDEDKKSKKDKKGSKGKKSKAPEPQEQVKETQSVQEQEQAPKKKKSSKKSKKAQPEPQAKEQAKEQQQPVKQSKKKGKKASKKQPVEQKVEEQLEQTLKQELAVEAPAVVTDQEPKELTNKSKGKKNKKVKKAKTQQKPAEQQPKLQQPATAEQSPVEQVKEQAAQVVQQAVEVVQQVKDELENTKQGKKSKGKGKGNRKGEEQKESKKGDDEKETKKSKKGGKKSKQSAKTANEQAPSNYEQVTAQPPSTQEPVATESQSTQ